MSCILPARWLVTLSALAAVHALAQSAPSPVSGASSTVAAAQLPLAGSPMPGQASPAYRSAFEGYRPFAQEGVSSWKDSNETVGEIGGWRAYAREAQEPQATQGKERAPATPAAANPHAGHGKP